MDPAEFAKLAALAMTGAIAAFTAAVLLRRDTPRRDQAVFLAVFLLLYSIFKFNDVVTATGGYAALPMLALATMPVRYLFGAAIYFYARSMTSPSPVWLRPRDALALLWPLAVLVWIVPFILMSPADKNDLMAGEFSSQEMRDWFVLSCKVIFALFLGSAFTYLYAAFHLLARHAREARNLFSNIENKALNWLRIVLAIVAVGWCWNAVSGLWTILGNPPHWVGISGAYIELAWICAIAYFGVLQGPVFDPVRGATAAEPEKYARSALDDARMARIAIRLEESVSGEALYADPSLSLRKLAGHLGVSEYYVSQTLNAKLGMNFFDFVNQRRIDAARELLQETDHPVAVIAAQVGFNARSTFHTAFKKHAGVTPARYRRTAGRPGPGVAASP